MRARWTRGRIRRALAALAALLLGTVGLAVGTAQPASAEAPNMVFHLFDDNVPWGYNGPFAQVIFDRSLDGGTVTWFADNVPMPECISTVTPGDPTYGCWPRKQLEPGDYTIRIDYSGSATFDPVSTPGGTLRIHEQATTITAIGPTTVDAGAATEVFATLNGSEVGADGPVVGATLTFSVAGSTCNAATEAAGTARCTLTAPGAPADLTVTYAGDSRHQGDTATQALALNLTPTTTSLSLVPNTTPWGTAVTATATISPAPTGGDVQFSTPGGVIAACDAVLPTGSTASCTFVAPPGTNQITAVYSGSGTHGTSSGMATLIGEPRPTTLTIASHDPLTVGVPATVVAQLVDTLGGFSAPAGLGIVITLGTASCNDTTDANGMASCQLTPTATAPTALAASFAGTAQYGPDTGQTTVAVAKGATTMVLSNPPTEFGAPLTITATIDQTDGGTVTFLGGGVPFDGCEAQPVTLVAGQWQATCTLHGMPAGTWVMSATYSGTANYEGTPVVWHQVTVSPATTTLTYTGPATATVGSPLDVSAMLLSQATGGGPISGQWVTFQWASGTCGGSTGLSGTSSCSLPVPHDAGPTSITISYAGEDRYRPAEITVPIVVGQAATTTAVQVPPTATFGEPTSLVALVQPRTAGTVAFTADGDPIAGCEDVEPVVLGADYAATCTTPDLAAGERQIGATFSGNGNYAPSTAPAQPLTVAPGPTALEYTGDTTGTIDVPVTLRARLTRNGTPPATGPLAGHDVTFTGAGGTCTAPTDASGVAECTITPDEVADGGPVTASFTATAEYQGAVTSAVLTVGRAPSTTTVASPNSAEFGEAVRLTAVVAPTDGDGTVTFLAAPSGASGAGAVIVGCGDVALALVGADWTATCDTSALPAGALTITATYSGGARHLPSSGTTAATIEPAWTAVAYTGASTGTVATPLTLSAALIVQPGGPPSGIFIPDLSYATAMTTAAPLPGMTLSFALGDLACSAVTDASGVASCTVTPTDIGQTGTVQVSFGGTAQYAAAQRAAALTIAPAATNVTLTAPATVGFSLPVELVATVAPAPPGGTVAFADGASPIAGCDAVPVEADGTARCTMPPPTLGAHDVSASFGGTSSYLPSTSSPSTVTVVPATAAVTYQGPTTATVGVPITVSAILTVTGPNPPVAGASGFTAGMQLAAQARPLALGIAGQELTFRLDTASCTGTTDASGTASCVLTPPTASGAATLVIEFPGSAVYQAVSIQLPLIVAATPMLPATGSDSSAPLALGAGLLVTGLAATRLRRRRA